jgi:hypothetical protein
MDVWRQCRNFEQLDVEIFGPFPVESDLSGTSPFERENAKIASGHERHCAGTTPAMPRRWVRGRPR